MRSAALAIVAVVAVSALAFFTMASRSQDTQNVALSGAFAGTEFAITSPAFEDGAMIPSEYTCDGSGVNPPIQFHNIPDGTQSLALIVDDPDIPDAVKEARGIEVFDHWVLFNILPHVTFIDADNSPGIEGVNGRGEQRYTGPCPPAEYEPTTHRYFFKAYALDSLLSSQAGTNKEDVLKAMKGNIIAETQLVGLYDKTTQQ